ncbi:MAG: hypothetical protein P4K98_02710, partial [Bryobacteraceae bacterium]|nr:hypothetical protein [Bryobacteraceae bacterium]
MRLEPAFTAFPINRHPLSSFELYPLSLALRAARVSYAADAASSRQPAPLFAPYQPPQQPARGAVPQQCDNRTSGGFVVPVEPARGKKLLNMLRVLSTHLFLNQRLHPGLLDLIDRSGAQAVEIFA